jgi:hemoglobin-like flavoprotein
MTTASLHRIRNSFASLVGRMTVMTDRFHARLFEVRPELRSMFNVDMQLHGRHFAAALALIVRNISILDSLNEPLRELGNAHTRAGVHAEHYPIVRDAILFAMAQTIPEQWTPNLAGDWQTLLDLVSKQMLAATADSGDSAPQTKEIR